MKYPIQKVLIMGLGLHGGGVGAAKFFAKQSKEVIVTDLKLKKELLPSLAKLKQFKNIRYALGKHRIKDFLSANLIIQGAGIPDDSPYLIAARKNHIPIDTDIGIFFERCPAPIIGITGSKGKSTVASLACAMLKQKYKKVFLGGNIRISVFDILPRVTRDSIVVLELSSWQLEGLSHHKKSPHVAVITNILREHLNKYKNFASYAKAKSYIFAFQKQTDYAVLNKNDFWVQKMARNIISKKIFFGKTKIVVQNPNLQGEHNTSNIAAAEAIVSLYGVSRTARRRAVKNYKGLEGRLQYVGTKKGVLFYNDTTATMPDATVAALKTLKPKRGGKIILIAGGADKKLDFRKLAREIAQRVSILILLPGDATKKIKSQIANHVAQKKITAYEAKNMPDAVSIAVSSAVKNDVVLLSPAAASFGLFQNEFDRGVQFVNRVKKI